MISDDFNLLFESQSRLSKFPGNRPKKSLMEAGMLKKNKLGGKRKDNLQYFAHSHALYFIETITLSIVSIFRT